MTDEELLKRFLDCSLPKEHWTHQAHLRVAYLHCRDHCLDEALRRTRSGIQRYNLSKLSPGEVNGYHETLTIAFIRLIYAMHLRGDVYPDSLAFVAAHPQLTTKTFLRQFYSPECISTPQAREQFVDADRSPLPIINDPISIALAAKQEDLSMVASLFLEYAKSLDFDLCFQNFQQELDNLPGSYGPPQGCLMLAMDRSEPVGCVALRPLRGDQCEMKRLWVRPSFRRRGLGRQLAQIILDHGRRIGYKTIRLDTINTMKPAITLYRSLGFRESSAYTDNPIEGATFFERQL